MPSDIRILRLLTAARVRSAGWAPWLLLAGWLIAAWLHEPSMLRGYGLYLLDDAAWSGGLLLFLALCLSEARRPLRAAIAANLLLLAALSLVLMTSCLLMDLGPWSAGPLDRLLHAAKFFVAFSPLAIALARAGGPHAPARLWRWAALFAFAALGTILSAALRAGDSTRVWSACGLAVAAAVAWTAPWRGRKYL